jgi:thymidylate kinase
MKQGGVITFSGVDGAGKTTILKEVRALLEQEQGLKVVELRQRPSLLPILSSLKYGKKAAELRTTEAPPRSGNNSSKVSSYIRFFYYLADYVFGQWVVYFKYTSKGYVVFYDRYFFDYIADPKRANILISQSFARFCYKLIFKPDINIFLFASSEEILKRKQELNELAISELTANYKQLFDELAEERKEKYVCIENIDKELTKQMIKDICRESV